MLNGDDPEGKVKGSNDKLKYPQYFPRVGLSKGFFHSWQNTTNFQTTNISHFTFSFEITNVFDSIPHF